MSQWNRALRRHVYRGERAMTEAPRATALQVGVFPADCRGQLIHHVRHRGARSWAENGRREDPRPLAGPGVCTLAHAVDEADEFLFALRRSTDDDQQALRVVLEAGLHVDAVDPEVDVAFGREIALAPARVLVRPGVLEPSDGRSRESAGVLAEQRDQRLLEIAGGDALEIEDRDQHFEALRSARIWAPHATQ